MRLPEYPRQFRVTQYTPEFVRWAIERPCPLRDLRRWQDPEQTARQLRPLRAYSDAVREGRILDGIGVAAEGSSQGDGNCAAEDMLAFSADEVLAGYGGRVQVESICGPCPANASGSPALAGCHGPLTLADSPVQRDALIRSALQASSSEGKTLGELVAAEFPRTTPPWYGLWIAEVPSRAQCEVLLQIAWRLNGLVADEPAHAELGRFAQGLQAALGGELPLHVVLYPAGQIAEGRWHIPPHCTRCRAPQAPRAGHCRVCGRNGRASEPRRRGLLGSRPFRPLESLLGERAAAEFLTRYAAHLDQLPSASS